MRVVAGNYANLTVGETTASRSYPSGAARVVENMVFETDGTVRRRSGIRAVASFIRRDRIAPIGVFHTIGEHHVMFCAERGLPISSMISVSDRVTSSDAPTFNRIHTLTAPFDAMNGVASLGPSAAIGDYQIMPAISIDGNPVRSPSVVDVMSTHFAKGYGAVQITNVQQLTQYDINVRVTDPSKATREFTLWVRSPSLEYPHQLNIADIPAVLADGRANPRYSQDVAARQADHARNRANWIRAAAGQLSTIGLAPFFMLAKTVAKATANADQAIDYGYTGDAFAINSATIYRDGSSILFSMPPGWRIESIRSPSEWKSVTNEVNTQDQLPPVGVEGQLVRIGKTDLILRSSPREKQWREIPRMQITGGLPLISVRITSGANNSTTTQFSLVNYGDQAPLPTSAPVDMANLLKSAGSPLRTMYISGRFCIVCEHAIMVSSASRPLDFFPKSAAAVAPGDGSIVEVSSSSTEFILDALPVRTGAFVLTNMGAYIVQVADITKLSIQKVRDTAFPAAATHSIANINGDIWHYWKTDREHSVRIYTESQYGSSWQSSNPIPQFDMTSERIPQRAQIIGTSTGDTAFLILDRRIKVISRASEGFAITTITHDVGDIMGAGTSGDALLLFMQTYDQATLLCRYDKSAPAGYLDAWSIDSPDSPAKRYVYRDGLSIAYGIHHNIPGSGPIVVGSLFSSRITLLPPPQDRVSTPSAWATMRDVKVQSRGTYAITVTDKYRSIDYANSNRSMEVVLGPIVGDWIVTHPIYRPADTEITISSTIGP